MTPEEHKKRLKFAGYHLQKRSRVAFYRYTAGLSLESAARLSEVTVEEAQRELDELAPVLEELIERIRPPLDPEPLRVSGFRYLLAPETLARGRTDPQPCVTCGAESAPAFQVIEESDEGWGWNQYFVCEPCLRAGRLEERGLDMNYADHLELVRQLALSGLPHAEQEQLARERTREVSCATPTLPTWQRHAWPAHCGDYFGFISQVVKEDVVAAAANGDGLDFFRRHVFRRGPASEDEWVTQTWKHGFYPQGFVHAYLWRCLHCGEHLITWDHD